MASIAHKIKRGILAGKTTARVSGPTNISKPRKTKSGDAVRGYTLYRYEDGSMLIETADEIGALNAKQVRADELLAGGFQPPQVPNRKKRAYHRTQGVRTYQVGR